MAGVAAGAQGLGMIGQTASNVMAADVNAKSLDAEARSVESQAAWNERQQRRQSGFAMGEANADTAAGGVDLTRGSPLLMELDRAKQSEIQALSIRRSGQVAASADRFQSRMVRHQIPGMIAGGVLGMGSILSQYAGRGGSFTGPGFGAAQ